MFLLGIELVRFLVVADGASRVPVFLVGFAQRVQDIGRRGIRRHIHLKDANSVLGMAATQQVVPYLVQLAWAEIVGVGPELLQSFILFDCGLDTAASIPLFE